MSDTASTDRLHLEGKLWGDLVPIENLVEEMSRRWRTGECPCAEEFLNRYPVLHQQPEAAVRLIYEEICQRQEQGQELDSSEVLRRFPQWHDQLELLLSCHRLMETPEQSTSWPTVGDTLGEFRLLEELGRGAQGRVFLAAQGDLADRPVVLKVTSRTGNEHLSLARLQHTHIVQLHAAYEDPKRNLRILCMPYFGGAPWHQVLRDLSATPQQDRNGRRLLQVLDSQQAGASVVLPALRPARHVLAQASYGEAVCLLGVCLADALHYAHERGLIHLDVKPSNVLLAADGQPMLLDFHLAQEPLRPDGPVPVWLGGSRPYMSPEQRDAMTAVRLGRPVSVAVDGRSDVYSLGLLLYEALGGTVPEDTGKGVPPLDLHSPHVSVGLADILGKCVAQRPEDRYQSASALATDLRRHLSHRPLRGVPNRSLTERWHKWRRRSPSALLFLFMSVAVLGAALTAGMVLVDQARQQRLAAEDALQEGRQQLKARAYAQAVDTLTRGAAVARDLTGASDLADQIHQELSLARRAQTVEHLHLLANRMRFLYGGTSLPHGKLDALQASWREFWDRRDRLLEHGGAALDPDVEQRLETDLLDLGVMWADLRVHLAGPDEITQAQEEALKVLVETEALFGPSQLVSRQRRACAEALGRTDTVREPGRRAAAAGPRSAWEHYALGRSLLQADDLEGAAAALERARELQPQGFWPNFYQGVCAYRRGKYQDAVTAFRVCVALAPDSAECYYNGALAQEALGEDARALYEYSQALEINPRMGSAALNRGLVHYRQKQYAEALTDLQNALTLGAEPTAVYYNLALVHLARQDQSAALDNVRRVLAANPRHQEAAQLRDRLTGGRRVAP